LDRAFLDALVEPGIRLGTAQRVTKLSDSKQRRALADLYATKADVLGRNRVYLTNADAAGADACTRAIEVAPEPSAKYFVDRGLFRIHIFKADANAKIGDTAWKKIQEDESQALALHGDKPYPDVHRLIASVLQTEAEFIFREDRAEALKKLKKVDEEYELAIAEARNDPRYRHERAVMLLNRCESKIKQANSSQFGDRAKRAECLDAAIRDADEALREHKDPAKVLASKSLALEDLAWICGRTEKYRAAAEVLNSAIDTARDSVRDDAPAREARFHIERGRCLVRSVAFGRLDPKGLDEAVTRDLRPAVQMLTVQVQAAQKAGDKGDDSEALRNLAEAHYWLGQAEWQQRKYDEAARDLDLCAQTKNAEWLLEALYQRGCVLLEQADVLQQDGRDGEADKRIDEAKKLGGLLDGKSPVSASYIRGRALELKKDYKAAYEEYTRGSGGATAGNEDKEPFYRVRFALRRMYLDPRLQGGELPKVAPAEVAEKGEEAIRAFTPNRHLFWPQAAAEVYGVTGLAHAAVAVKAGGSAEESIRKAVECYQQAVDLIAPDGYQGWRWRFEAARQMGKIKGADRAKAAALAAEAEKYAPEGEVRLIRELQDKLNK
jgi:hypothetical protein